MKRLTFRVRFGWFHTCLVVAFTADEAVKAAVEKLVVLGVDRAWLETYAADPACQVEQQGTEKGR